MLAFTPVVKLLDVLFFREQLCLVMELLDDTLLPYTLMAGAERRQQEHRDQTVATTAAATCDLSRSYLWNKGARDEHRALPRSRIAFGVRAVAQANRTLDKSGWGRDVGEMGVSSMARRMAHAGGGGEYSGCIGRSSMGVGAPTHVVRDVALQLVSALLLMHNHGFVHADIKPDNVLLRVDNNGEESSHNNEPEVTLDDIMHRGVEGGAGGPSWGSGCMSAARMTVKLCDFGNAVRDNEVHHYYDNNDFEIQTLAYRAPEVSRVQTR